MSFNVVCLRPEADFLRVDAPAPASLDVAYRAPADADVPDLLKAATALVIPAVGPKLATALFERAALKLIQVTGAGVDRLDQAGIARLGIPVANVPGGSNGALAEYCVTAASLLLRRFMGSSADIRAGAYVATRARLLSDNVGGLDGLLVGIVGFGVIGAAVAAAFHRAGSRIAYFDPAPRDPAAAAAIGAQGMPLDELLASADVVSLHVPLLPQTENLIGAAELARMKDGAVLIQASRGGIVDEAALAFALTDGMLGGAAVDVYATEPPAPDNPLLALTGDAAQRTLLTPHIAGVTRQSAAFLFRSAWRNVEHVVRRDGLPENRVY